MLKHDACWPRRCAVLCAVIAISHPISIRLVSMQRKALLEAAEHLHLRSKVLAAPTYCACCTTTPLCVTFGTQPAGRLHAACRWTMHVLVLPTRQCGGDHHARAITSSMMGSFTVYLLSRRSHNSLSSGGHADLGPALRCQQYYQPG